MSAAEAAADMAALDHEFSSTATVTRAQMRCCIAVTTAGSR